VKRECVIFSNASYEVHHRTNMDFEHNIFYQAIVRPPGLAFANALTTTDLGMPNLSKALEQHEAYLRAIERCGVAVRVLETDDFPDSTFVEDVAICTPDCAIMTRPGAPSRTGEVASMKTVLADYFDNILGVDPPGTLDGGDVLDINGHFYIGLSARTNEAGADQLIRMLNDYGMTGEKVLFPAFLHLKSGVSWLENDTVLLVEQFADLPQFQSFDRIILTEEHGYAANSICVNGTVIMPAGYDALSEKLGQYGRDVIKLEMTEFQKVDGGVSCLSLRF
jgi:dimethylargininase